MAKLAFDTGGTFTDFALLDDDGELHLHKVLSTPKNPAEAVVQGATELLDRFGSVIDLGETPGARRHDRRHQRRPRTQGRGNRFHLDRRLPGHAAHPQRGPLRPL